mgnify:CR=1 FL=1
MFHHILVPLDGSVLAECVLPHVVAVARASNAQVTLLQVVECPHCESAAAPVDPLHWRMRMAEAQAYLHKLAERLQPTGLSIDTVLLEGQAASGVVDFLRAHDIDLIALSSHGEGGMSAWNIGGMVHKIIQRAHISALIVRAYSPSASCNLTELHYARILAPVDGSPRADYALGPAASLAQCHNARLILAHIVKKTVMFPRTPAQAEYEELAERLLAYNRCEAIRYLEKTQARLDRDVETRVVVGDDVVECLHQLAEAEAIDLVVLNAHGKSGKTKWPFGSVCANMILYGATPLLIVQDLPAQQIEPTHAERYAKERAGH